MNNQFPLLELRNVSKKFRVINALHNVSFSIPPGETLGLVGESGSGKSTLGKLIVGMEALTSGAIFFKGQEISRLSNHAFKPYRRHIQMVFQDPYSSLNPCMRVKAIVGEGLQIHKIVQHERNELYVEELLEKLGLHREYLDKYPHELSGGQRQRVGIARALALEPELVILDEPLSALDVGVQVQILELLKELQKDLGLSYLFISHDISALKKIAHRIAVMYLGELIEYGRVEEIFSRPKHPYTESLIKSVPVSDPVAERKRSRDFLRGGCRVER